MNRTFYEFFCGGGMARLGLGKNWQCLLANDIDPKKIATYTENFGQNGVKCADVYSLRSVDMPGNPDLAWASFPCQDLSLAGNRGGLAAVRSGSFWGFWQAIQKLKSERRSPNVLVLENVVGMLTSSGGGDFREVCAAMVSLGYRFGAVLVDAVRFLPQSRPRLFIICIDEKVPLPLEVLVGKPSKIWHPQSIQDAHAAMPSHIKSNWIWWDLPEPSRDRKKLKQLVERKESIGWHTPAETSRLLAMMSETNRIKLSALCSGETVYGTGYKRMRVENGSRVQRFEVRFDDVAGCLRTPGGGSSRQVLVKVENREVQTRLLTVREAARLMGVPDGYRVPKNYNEGYHIFGDGLAVPVVSHIEKHILCQVLGYSDIKVKELAA